MQEHERTFFAPRAHDVVEWWSGHRLTTTWKSARFLSRFLWRNAIKANLCQRVSLLQYAITFHCSNLSAKLPHNEAMRIFCLSSCQLCIYHLECLAEFQASNMHAWEEWSLRRSFQMWAKWKEKNSGEKQTPTYRRTEFPQECFK